MVTEIDNCVARVPLEVGVTLGWLNMAIGSGFGALVNGFRVILAKKASHLHHIYLHVLPSP